MIKKCVACNKEFDAATNRKRFCSYYCATGHVHELSWLLPQKVVIRKRAKKPKKRINKMSKCKKCGTNFWFYRKRGLCIVCSKEPEKQRKQYGTGKPNPRNVKLMKEYKAGKSCERCESTKQLAVHHIDHNKHNNCFENYMVLCVKCHRLEHPDLPDMLFRCLEE